MRLKTNKSFLATTVILFCVIQCEIAACYKTEIEITPSPIDEPTTKKSGFFSGIKSFFVGSSSTSTTTVKPAIAVNKPNYANTQQMGTTNTVGGASVGPQRPPPLQKITPDAPLMPLGPRPDTPPTSPLSGNQHQAPQWPQVQTSTTTTTARPLQINKPLQKDPQRSNGVPQFPNFPQGVGSYQPPSKSQPSGLDLSYGHSGARPQNGNRPGFGFAPATSTSTTPTTSTTTARNLPAAIDLDLRGGYKPATTTTTTKRPSQVQDHFPPLPPPRKQSTGVKEDFPSLPTPKSPHIVAQSTTAKPTSPSAWNVPNIPNNDKFFPGRPNSPATSTSSSSGGQHGVSFVPHVPGMHTSSTVRPGFETTGNNLATDDEIMKVTEVLYTKENSHLSQIRVNVQGKTRSIDSTDEAPQPLLDIDSKFTDSPTIAKMRLLFNNYEADTTVNEHVAAIEHKEENDFVDSIMTTPVMRQTMLFLQDKGIVTPDPKTHRDLLKELWFTQYSRGGGKIGSSGFEHVFLHEVKNGTIIGFHNWIYFADEEKAGRLDYKGYLKELDLGTKGKVVKMRFSHNGLNKPVNSLFVGTTPELELALYTLCFKLRPDRTCPVSLGNNKFGVVTYSWRSRGKSLIGSAFPEI